MKYNTCVSETDNLVSGFILGENFLASHRFVRNHLPK